MSIFLNCVYLAILLFASPILLYRMLRYGKYRDGWSEKFLGRIPVQERKNSTKSSENENAHQRVWFHAVSVGEVLQLQTVLRQFTEHFSNVEILVTTTTVTGLAVAQEKFPEHTVCYFPLDFSWAVRNAVKRYQPDLVVLVELELWPNFIREVHRRGIPLMLINGRISEKSFRGYRKIRFLMRRLLDKFACLAVQNETYANRLQSLGANAENVIVTGSIKFDGVSCDRNNPQTRELKTAFQLEDNMPVFIAGSTHPPEEEIALNVWQKLRGEFPDLRLILIPRHKERFDEVAKLVESRQLPLLRRTATRGEKSLRTSSEESPPVLLLDTLGELSACWGLADIAFVGGSLTPRGGQNMIEPAAYGAAVLFGPQTRNFRDVVDVLLQAEAARVVQNESELENQVAELLRNREVAREMGARAQQVVFAQQGATAKTVSLIGDVLNG